jgi:ATP-dependent DNA helicase RecG
VTRQTFPAPLEQLNTWLEDEENEQLEFKEARSSFNKEKLIQYCLALANEGGGKLILGVTDKRPRKVSGSSAFGNLEQTKHELGQIIRLRVEAEALDVDSKRVVVFHVPSRPLGVPMSYKGTYLMRSGESLVPMTQDMLKRIFAETVPDFSATFCEGATLNDLEPRAIEEFRTLRHKKTGKADVLTMSSAQLLEDAELIRDGSITYAALALLGSHRGLGRHLAQAEVIFEYRSSEASIAFQERHEFREGFLGVHDALWELINKRNDIQSFQSGLFRNDIPTFNERAVREALLNAIGHRDYQRPGSVFVRQYPRKLVVVSPGGLPSGITLDNILWRQEPRNRRIADALGKCNLIERSGQGMDLMVKACILESKPQPDFWDTDDYQVSLTLHGEIQNEQFLRFLEKVGQERLDTFSTEDFLVLDTLAKDQAVPEAFKPRLARLVESGVVEKLGNRGRGVRYILSRALYSFVGQKGVYTRKRGLDRETHKALLLKHIRDNDKQGSKFDEFTQVLPELTRNQLQSLLRELRTEHKIWVDGRTKAAKWHARRDA